MKRVLLVLTLALLWLGGEPAGAQPVAPKEKDVLQGKSLADYLANLNGKDDNKRREALRIITILGPRAKEAVPALVEALQTAIKEKNQQGLIWELANALGAIGADARAAVPLLSSQLSDKGGWGNTSVAYALISIGAAPAEEKAATRVLLLTLTKCSGNPLLNSPAYLKDHAAQFVPALASLLTDPQEYCRAQAAACLVVLGPAASKANPALEKALNDKSVPVRIQAAMALAKSAPGKTQAAIDAMIACLPDVNHTHGACQALQTIGIEAVPAILEQLRQAKGPLRQGLLSAVGGMDAVAVPLLVKELEGDSVAGRTGAAQGLGYMGKAASPARDALLTALRDAEEEVRFQAAHSLVWIEPATSAPVLDTLIALLDSKQASLRQGAASSLQAMERLAVPAIARLKAALADPQREVRLAAGLALVAIDAKEGAAAVPVLLDHLDTKKGQPNQNIILALGKIGPPANAAVPALRKVLISSQPHLRPEIARALLQVDPGQAEAVVNTFVVELYEDSLDEIALEFLGEMGPAARGILPLLRVFLDTLPDQDRWLKQDLLRAAIKIDRMQGKAFLATLRADLKSKNRGVVNNAVELLCEMAPALPAETVPLLGSVLGDPRTHNRHLEVIGVLTKLGPAAKEALPALKGLPTGNNPELQGAVKEALSRIDRPLAAKGRTK